ncbi:MAG: hypothetical protein ACI9UA_005559, partial [Pseudoalteromonas tetraodonis]
RSKLELKLTPMAILGSSDRLSKRKPRRLRQIISIESHFRSHTIILVPAASCDEFPSLVIRANSSRSSSAPSDEIFVYTSNCPGTDILRSRSSSTDRPATSAASALRSKTPSPYRSATFEEIAVSLSSSTPRAPSADPPVFPRSRQLSPSTNPMPKLMMITKIEAHFFTHHPSTNRNPPASDSPNYPSRLCKVLSALIKHSTPRSRR